MGDRGSYIKTLITVIIIVKFIWGLARLRERNEVRTFRDLFVELSVNYAAEHYFHADIKTRFIGIYHSRSLFTFTHRYSNIQLSFIGLRV